MSSRDKAHDFSETACSGSTVSTPEQSNAFTATDGLNQTVLRFEKVGEFEEILIKVKFVQFFFC